MATQLGLYNGALRLCKERKLASLSENREPRRLLDDAWGDGATTGAVRHCLQLGQWTFATRTAEVAYSPSVEPSFGHRYAFDQPSDMVRVVAICEDEYFNVPLLQYVDERRYWYASVQTIYVKWTSNDAAYGADLSNWPASFEKMVEAYLANEIVHNLTQDDKLKLFVDKEFEKAKKSALSLDAMNKPTVMMPEGSWNCSRRGNAMRESRWNGSFR